jgi:hypothetical protein
VELACIDARNTTTTQAKGGRLRFAKVDYLFKVTVLQKKRTKQKGGFQIKMTCDASSPQFYRTWRTIARAAVACQQSHHEFCPYHSVGIPSQCIRDSVNVRLARTQIDHRACPGSLHKPSFKFRHPSIAPHQALSLTGYRL